MAVPMAHMLDSENDVELMGEFVITMRSVALNTDLSMMDIELLHAEVTALRKEVALLQHGISTNSSKGTEPNHELYGGGAWPSVLCKAEPGPVPGLVQKQGTSGVEPALRPRKPELSQIHLYHADQFHRLDLCSERWPTLRWKTEPIPVLIVPQETSESVLNPHLHLKQELGLVPDCKAEPFTSFMKEEEEHHIFLKPEPELVKIMEMCLQEPPAPAPLKTCSVMLVDCRRTLERTSNTQSPEEEHASEDEWSRMSINQSAATRGKDEEHVPEDEDGLSMSTTQDEEMCDEEEYAPEDEGRLNLGDEEQSFTFSNQREASVRTEVNNGGAGQTPGPHKWRKRKRRNQEKLFPCSFCERSFFRRCNLSMHLRVHYRETAPSADQQQQTEGDPFAPPPRGEG